MEQEKAPVAARPHKQDRSTLALLMVAALVAIGGVGFAAGRFTAPAAASTGNGPGAGNGGFNFGRGARPSLAPGQTFNVGQFGGGAGAFRGLGGATEVTGTVQSVDSSTITLKLANGSTVTIALNGSTTYHSETSASAGDVQTGSTVTIQIDTSALASESPNPSASGAFGGRTLTAGNVLITTP